MCVFALCSSVQINMAPPPELQNHVAQGRIESVFDECDPEGADRVKRTVLRDALLEKGFTENFVDVCCGSCVLLLSLLTAHCSPEAWRQIWRLCFRVAFLGVWIIEIESEANSELVSLHSGRLELLECASEWLGIHSWNLCSACALQHLDIQLNGHGAEYVTKSAFDECLKRLPSRIFMYVLSLEIVEFVYFAIGWLNIDPANCVWRVRFTACRGSDYRLRLRTPCVVLKTLNLQIRWSDRDTATASTPIESRAFFKAHKLLIMVSALLLCCWLLKLLEICRQIQTLDSIQLGGKHSKYAGIYKFGCSIINFVIECYQTKKALTFQEHGLAFSFSPIINIINKSNALLSCYSSISF